MPEQRNECENDLIDRLAKDGEYDLPSRISSAATTSGRWLVTTERIGPGTSTWRRKLESGEWEPFAVTGKSDYGEMWFRKWVPDAASA